MKTYQNRLDSHSLKEQAGFRRHYATIDQIHTLNQVLEKIKEYKIDLHMLFEDYRKAFK